MKLCYSEYAVYIHTLLFESTDLHGSKPSWEHWRQPTSSKERCLCIKLYRNRYQEKLFVLSLYYSCFQTFYPPPHHLRHCFVCLFFAGSNPLAKESATTLKDDEGCESSVLSAATTDTIQSTNSHSSASPSLFNIGNSTSIKPERDFITPGPALCPS